MKKTRLLILGSTGSIGTQTLDIIRANPDRFTVVGLSANSNAALLADQIDEFKPEFAILADTQKKEDLLSKVSYKKTEIFFGDAYCASAVDFSTVDIVLNSLVGFAGFIPTFNALKKGIKVALANKESLVVGGELLSGYTKNGIQQLVPVDSEHSAILQCLVGEENNPVEKMLITASGGPFRTWKAEEMASITVEQALNHPNWSMGSKITIDSATMMNKGLEIIEAFWLFNIPLEKIEPVIHPQSIIHSMVTFEDGSSKAQLGYPDMKVPIQYALTWPERIPLETPRMDFSKLRELTFEPVDYAKFPCLKLALESIAEGGYAPAILNASNEIAVGRFLRGEIPYICISQIVQESLQHISSSDTLSVESLTEIDRKTRIFASNIKI